MKRFLLIAFLFFCLQPPAGAQFAPQAGVAGSTAISGSSSAFVGWATQCTVQRGYANIALPDSGYATAGTNANGIGASDGTIVSLGDSGVAVLTFASPIYDGPGADFAIFENGFANPIDPTQAFLELAFVEVSSDGVNYFRFPAASYTQDTAQVPDAGVYMDASKINNLAGKYIGGYGTPFDLSELAGIPGLDINNVTHVRLVDVVGALNNFGTVDTGGRKINDPYPTQFATGGFDLDAVGVIHQVGVSGVQTFAGGSMRVYPNPTSEKITIECTAKEITAMLTDVAGRAIYMQPLTAGSCDISLTQFSVGIYYLTLRDKNGSKWVQKITRL